LFDDWHYNANFTSCFKISISVMTQFLLIRHATNDTVGKLLAGRKEGIHLNKEGQGQALELARRLKDLDIKSIYSSPLERTLETAVPLAEALNLEVMIAEDFLEINYGAWTYATFEDLSNSTHFQRFNTFRSHTRVPEGETMAEAQLRFVQGLQKLCRKHSGETVAIVSHADMIKAALAFYAGIHLDMFQRLEISPASVSILEINDYTSKITLLNHTGEVRH
jgi:probable phosphomutase (TIGR03848 family)